MVARGLWCGRTGTTSTVQNQHSNTLCFGPERLREVRVHLTFGWWAVPAANLAVFAAAAVSQWPAIRAVRRLDIARVVRERAR